MVLGIIFVRSKVFFKVIWLFGVASLEFFEREVRSLRSALLTRTSCILLLSQTSRRRHGYLECVVLLFLKMVYMSCQHVCLRGYATSRCIQPLWDFGDESLQSALSRGSLCMTNHQGLYYASNFFIGSP